MKLKEGDILALKPEYAENYTQQENEHFKKRVLEVKEHCVVVEKLNGGISDIEFSHEYIKEKYIKESISNNIRRI